MRDEAGRGADGDPETERGVARGDADGADFVCGENPVHSADAFGNVSKRLFAVSGGLFDDCGGCFLGDGGGKSGAGFFDRGFFDRGFFDRGFLGTGFLGRGFSGRSWLGDGRNRCPASGDGGGGAGYGHYGVDRKSIRGFWMTGR